MHRKSKDPFEVFKQATLRSNSSLRDSLSASPEQEKELVASSHENNDSSDSNIAQKCQLKAILIT